MHSIHKYPLIGYEVQLPRGAKFLSVQRQYEVPVVWAEVDPTGPMVSRRLHIVGTGWMFDPTGLVYIGTLQDGDLVWHYYLSEGPE